MYYYACLLALRERLGIVYGLHLGIEQFYGLFAFIEFYLPLAVGSTLGYVIDLWPACLCFGRLVGLSLNSRRLFLFCGLLRRSRLTLRLRRLFSLLRLVCRVL